MCLVAYQVISSSHRRYTLSFCIVLIQKCRRFFGKRNIYWNRINECKWIFLWFFFCFYCRCWFARYANQVYFCFSFLIFFTWIFLPSVIAYGLYIRYNFINHFLYAYLRYSYRYIFIVCNYCVNSLVCHSTGQTTINKIK